MSKNWKNWVILMFHYLDFLHDASATQNGLWTHFLVALLLQLQQCEHSHWIQCNPFVAAKKSQPQPHRVNGPLSYNHTERQRQRLMLVYGDDWEWVWDRFSSVTIDQHWPLTLGVIIPLVYILPQNWVTKLNSRIIKDVRVISGYTICSIN